jgi:hypothetical protein
MLVQQDQAVHLPGEANARDVLSPDAWKRQHAPYSPLCTPPPVLGILLTPERVRRIEGILLSGAG